MVSMRRAHPRWRGADHIAMWNRVTLNGLIPAGAGQTSLPARYSRAGWAHPRWRGADFCGVAHTIVREGSSPLARGRHFLTCTLMHARRVFASLSAVASAFAGVAPSRSYPGQVFGWFFVGGAEDQVEAVEVHGLPVVSVDLESEALF